METPSQYLKAALYDRIARNQAYSLRAFARDLGLSHTYLSLVINNKKNISAHQAAWMADVLGFEAEKKGRFIESTLPSGRSRVKKKGLETFQNIEIDQLRYLSGWQHWALLDLTLTKDFEPDPRWIAKRLGISVSRVNETVDRLERLGLLERKGGKWKKVESHLAIPTTRSHSCMRQLHRELILKGVKSLASGKQSDYNARSISGAMIPTNPERLEQAKKKIAAFRRSLIRFLSEGESTEVYQLNLQLFPLTRRGKNK